MPLYLNIIKQPDGVILESNNKEFAEEGGSIGRAEHCDVFLPDATQTISKIHALIHFRDNMYFITDVSTNGVFVNGETIPIGKGNTKQILEGERFSIGDYEIKASYNASQNSIEEIIQPQAAPSNNDIENLLASDDDISDLLDIEVNNEPLSREEVLKNNAQSIDDLIAGIGVNENDSIDLDSLTTDDADINALLGNDPIDTSAKIDVMAQIDVTSKSAAQTFADTMMALDEYTQQNPEYIDVVNNIKLYLQSQQDQIIGSS